MSWGCGSACAGFAIVDARTGSVFVAPFTVSIGGHLEQEEDMLQYRPDSKLLIVTGAINEANYEKRFYRCDNGRLTLIQKVSLE